MFKKRVIVFIGNDGSGKTYQAKRLAEKFSGEGVSVKAIHFDHLLLRIPKFASSGGYFSAHEEKDQSIKLFKVLKGNKAFGLIFPVIVYIDFLLFYLFKVILTSEKVLILDRYFYDKLVKFYDLKICNQKIFNLLLKLTPIPSYTFYFNLPAEVGFKRKREMTVSILNRRRIIYDKIVENFGLITINADQKKKIIFSDILKRLKYD